MAKFVDCDMEFFLSRVLSQENKRFIACGAGRKLNQLCKMYGLEKRISFILDNDKTKQGKMARINGRDIPVYGYEYINSYRIKKDDVVIISTIFMARVIEQLSTIENLKFTEVYAIPFIQDNCSSEEIVFTRGESKIPKTIHYCWFGNSGIPDIQKKYIEGWHKLCPDYEIKEWNESNYDVTQNAYMYEAYKNKKWGFVPDYARLDIIYQNGGIYLDTDVEIIRPFDDMLNDEAFIGFGSYSVVTIGAGFGSVPQNSMIGELRDYYDNVHFELKDGNLDMRPCTDHQAPILCKWGVEMNNKQQKVNGMMIYPMEVMNPLGLLCAVDKTSKHTHSVHRVTGSWESSQNMKEYNMGRSGLKGYFERISDQ